MKTAPCWRANGSIFLVADGVTVTEGDDVSFDVSALMSCGCVLLGCFFPLAFDKGRYLIYRFEVTGMHFPVFHLQAKTLFNE